MRRMGRLALARGLREVGEHGEVRRGGPQPTLLSKETASGSGAVFLFHVLRIKLVLTDVWRVKDTYDKYGNPAYLVRGFVLLPVRPLDPPCPRHVVRIMLAPSRAASRTER